MAASSAFNGSTSQTITFAPRAFALNATPLPHHPYPETTTVLPATSMFAALITPSNEL